MFTGNNTIEDMLDLQSAIRIDHVCNNFEETWQGGKQPKIEVFLGGFVGSERKGLLGELVALEIQYRHEQGDLANSTEYLRRFPGFEVTIHEAFARGLSDEAFVNRLSNLGLLEPAEIALLRSRFNQSGYSRTAATLARSLVSAGKLTEFQADTVLNGRSDPLLLGDYRIDDKLGSGGMGVVYEAYHARLGKRVALKVLRRELTADGQMLARFEREMKAVGQLNHPNIVCAYDAREDDGLHYLVMELVEGEDVARLVDQHGPLAIGDACEIVRQAALGLQHAHEHKLVHRDIKPSNLMLTVEGHLAGQSSTVNRNTVTVKVLDLGLARLDRDLSNGLTSEGQVMGTIDYMAPEQADDSNEVNIRGDIYSLGATLFKLLCGSAPFEDPSTDTVLKKLSALANASVPSIKKFRPEISSELVNVVDRMLAKKPRDRFTTPFEIAEALEPFASGNNLAALLELTRSVDETICDRSNTETSVNVSPDSNDMEPSLPTHGIPETTETIAITEAKRQDVQGWGRYMAIAIGFAAVVALAIIFYRIQTHYGTVVVEINDKSVAAQLTADGLKVFDESNPNKKWTIEFKAAGKKSVKSIPPGKYRTTDLPGVELYITDSSGAEYTAREFKVVRGGNVRIRIQSDTLNKTPTDTERRVAELMLDLGWEVQIYNGPWVKSRIGLPTEPFFVIRILGTNPTLTDADLEPLAELKSLDSLDLRATSVTGKVFQHFRNKELAQLYLGPKFDTTHLVHLQQFRRLNLIDLSRVEDPIKDLALLAKLPNLGSLGLGPATTPACVAQLVKFRKLNDLSIRGVGVSAAEFAVLQTIPNLTRLHVGGRQLTAESVEQLARLKELRRLDIFHKFTTKPLNTSILMPLTQLQTLYVAGLLDDTGLLRLAELTDLRELDVQFTRVTEDGIRALSGKLPSCKIVTAFGTFGPKADRHGAE